MILGCTVVSARFQAYAPSVLESDIVQHGELFRKRFLNFCTESAKQPWSAIGVERGVL